MQQKQGKKPTRGDMERKIRSSIVFVPKDKDTKSIFFDDKGLRLTVTDDYVVIATGAHQHVFNNVTGYGISRPYLYTKRFIEIALENDCTITDKKGNEKRSYTKLFALLKAKEDKSEYDLCWFIDLWLNNIFMPLYGIDETESAAFLVYEQYLHNVSRQKVILQEKQDDMTNLQFVQQVLENERKFVEGMDERVIFTKKTDEEKAQEEVEALQSAMIQDETEKEVKEQDG